jgi:hypothetical protein
MRRVGGEEASFEGIGAAVEYFVYSIDYVVNERLHAYCQHCEEHT